MNIEIIGSLVTGICTIIAAVGAMLISLRNSKKINEVHILVNSNMTKALNEISQYTKRIALLTGNPADIKIAQKASLDNRTINEDSLK
jgi:hypothetical protein